MPDIDDPGEGRSWRKAAPGQLLLISVFFSLQKVLIYEVPQAHLDHLGHQVSITGIFGRWGIVGHRGIEALGEEALGKFSIASSLLYSAGLSIPGPPGPKGDRGENSVLGNAGACMRPAYPTGGQDSVDEA